MYDTYPFQKYKFTHYCLYVGCWSKKTGYDSQLHFYLWSDQQKKKKNTLQCHCEIKKKKKYVHKGENKFQNL